MSELKKPELLIPASSLEVLKTGKVFIGLDLFYSFMAIIAALILTTPITFRLARNIYINIFVGYNPNATKNAHND